MAFFKGAFDIVCPLIKNDGLALVEVTAKSTHRHRKAVETLARYFKREEDYDFLQYTAAEKDPIDIAFLWTPPETAGLTGLIVPCVGACCFRKEETWRLDWVWIHPFCRRRKLLTGAWPKFKEQFGEFDIEPPLSEAMEKALEKLGHPQKKLKSRNRCIKIGA